MPKSKAAPRRAQKLQKRRERQAKKPVSYTFLLDTLREALNNRFYEEQGFPHLEILSQNYDGPVGHGRLDDYMQLQDMFIGFAYALAAAIRANAPYSMEEREDRAAGVAYAMAATLLNIRPDYVDDSGWMGSEGLFRVLRERWGRAKMAQAGIDLTNRFMDPRDLCCLVAMDFVMTLLDMTGELAQMGGDKVMSVTECKDEIITAFTGYATSNTLLAQDKILDLEEIFRRNAVTEEFLHDYPDWKPEAADALNPDWLGFNSIGGEDAAFMATLMSNEKFMHDMQVLYTGDPNAVPQGRREEIVMGYALRYGPRCQKAFAADRDPTEEEMDRDAEVINAIAMQIATADAAAKSGAGGEETAAYTLPQMEAGRVSWAANLSKASPETVEKLIEDARTAIAKEKAAAEAEAKAAEAVKAELGKPAAQS